MELTKKILCEKCNKSFESRGFKSHYKFCGVEVKRKGYIKRPQFQPERMNCIFCNKLCKNYNSRINHERLCSKNENRDISYFISHQHEIRLLHQSPDFKYLNQFTKAKELGLIAIVSEETRNKLKKHLKSIRENRSIEEKKRIDEAISNTIRKKVEEGVWHTSLAKRMHYDYNGIDLHGTWELNYAKWLDKNNIKWVRCKRSFSYFFEGKMRRYTPDFYLPETNEYVEIKGFKTKKDESKWEQFPKDLKLSILMEKDLKEMGVI